MDAPIFLPSLSASNKDVLHEGRGCYHNEDMREGVKVKKDIPKTSLIKIYFFCHPNPIYF